MGVIYMKTSLIVLLLAKNCRIIGHESATIGREPYGTGGQTPYNSGDYRIS
ncbi:hypothetical protein ACEQPO_18160 [Bacillus sp. SL00103]